MTDVPIHVSRSTAGSLWQEYRIYDNRLEFETMFGLMTVPFEHVEELSVSESEVKGLMRGYLHLKGFRPALKLDWANFLEHVVLDKNRGLIRRVLFTPDDPESFKRILDQALARYRER